MMNNISLYYRTYVVKLFLIASSGISLVFVGAPALHAISPTITYQAKLTSDTGSVVTDGEYNMQFRLCTDSDCANPVWTESYIQDDRVEVENGLFSVYLGSVNPFDDLDFGQELYLGVNIGGTENTATPNYDGEMTPRKSLGVVNAAIVSRELKSDRGGNSINASSSETLFEITQTGSGDAFRVNDQSGDTTSFVIDAEGRVGIGALTPEAFVNIDTGSANLVGDTDILRIDFNTQNGSGQITDGVARIGLGQGRLDLASVEGGALEFDISGTAGSNTLDKIYRFLGETSEENVVIDSGKVGIGISEPAYTLDVNGDINITGDIYQNGVPLGGGGKFITGASTTDAVYTEGRVGIGLSDPSALLELASSTETQLKLSFDLSNFAEFSVSALGGLSISTSGGVFSLPDDNLEVCSSEACPSDLTDFASSTTGNVVVENSVYIGGGLLIGNVNECNTDNKGQLRNSADRGNLEQCNGFDWVAVDAQESYGVVYFAIDETSYVRAKSYGFAANGTLSGSATSVLTDNAASFGADIVGKRVLIYDGTGAGQERAITAQTSQTITLESALNTATDDTSAYIIGDRNDLFEYDTSGDDPKVSAIDDGDRRKTYSYDNNDIFCRGNHY